VADVLPPVCILAGGLGTRLGEHVRTTPKPLIEVAGQPFLLHQLRLLRAHGAQRVVLCVGYLGDQIERVVGPEQFGIAIDYSYDSAELDGTLGAIRGALPLLADRFLVLYGDTYLRIDYRDASAAWQRSGLPAMMTVLRNEGRWDVSNVEFDGERVTVYDKQSPSPAMEWIDYGLGGLEASIVDAAGGAERDLSRLYHALAPRGLLFGYRATERFYEIGTPEALAETSTFLAGGAAAVPAPGAER
jgi:NDP-sugar pyrophosphorylase family protein